MAPGVNDISKDNNGNNILPRKKRSNQLLGCVICDKTFDTFNELRRHKRTHVEKPYCCFSCDQRFNNFGSQQKHTKTHSHDEMNCEKENPTADEEKMHDETQ